MNILAVGAYERDNFGDLLFLYILRKLLKDKANIIPSSIVFSDMRKINGEVIFPYDFLLKKYKFDGIFTVGGEVGGVDIVGALMMDISKKENEAIFRNKQDLNEIVEFYTNISQESEKHAYIIDRRDYPLNLDTPNILNSVGLSNIKNLNDKFLLKTQDILKNSFISVREEKSHNLLSDYGIESKISPDVVHTIRIFRKKKKASGRYVVFQINHDLIQKNNLEYGNIAEKLKIIANTANSDIKLFLAGVTEGHDDIDDYNEIVKEFNKIENEKTISIIDERDPLKLVDYISGSIMWIGTSLHGRIISAAYDVPRISLLNNKVSNYAQKWDSDMPHDIKIADITKELIKTVLLSEVKIGENLAEKALSNFNKLFEESKIVSSNNKIDELEIFFDYINGSREKFMEIICSKNSIIRNLENNMEKLTHDNLYYEQVVQDIKDSKSYKISEKLSTIKSTIKNR